MSREKLINEASQKYMAKEDAEVRTIATSLINAEDLANLLCAILDNILDKTPLAREKAPIVVSSNGRVETYAGVKHAAHELRTYLADLRRKYVPDPELANDKKQTKPKSAGE